MFSHCLVNDPKHYSITIASYQKGLTTILDNKGASTWYKVYKYFIIALWAVYNYAALY